jgi:CBS domain-containing protein
MSVRRICSYNVATIGRDRDIIEAAVKMREEHVGDLIVVEQRGTRNVPVGIITDRDIVIGIVARRAKPEEITVGDAMTTKLLTVKQDNGIDFLLREMRRVGVRRAPVVDDGGELVGVVSIDDAIDHIAGQLDHIANAIRAEQRTETKARP